MESHNVNAAGSCNCDAVKFEVSTPISDVYVCHCSICRKSTGNGGIAVCIVSNESFKWTQGQSFMMSWDKPNHDWQSNFCKNCGSSLPGKNDESSTYIPVGLFDSGHEKLAVKHHLYTAFKGSWEKFNDNGVQHKNNFCAGNT